MTPIVYQHLMAVLKVTTVDEALTIAEAFEVFARAFVSVALSAADGDNAEAAAVIKTDLVPNLLSFADALAAGGKSEVVVAGGHEVH